MTGARRDAGAPGRQLLLPGAGGRARAPRLAASALLVGVALLGASA